ncbi:ATP-binding cassette domain-containing protein [Streptomyces sp. NPDC050848]|uniref:ABC transporter ATP-binding protein n=1 Tax=Streptomyces sp. NPDC050848 TaxID=3155791 RepID=UPI00340C3889
MKLEGVGRRYGPRGPWVVREVDLVLPAGALVRFTGTNGSGKSTLLRLVAGIDAPTEGRIAGRPPRTSYVPERFPVALPFTATGYLTHLGRIQGLGRAEAAARAGEWLERFGASAFAGTPLAELSKGSSQKVAVAQALLADPALIVLDEAWTGLDTAARHELDRAVRERVAAGGTAVFVDHDPRRLSGEADAVYEVEAGRVRVGRVPGPVPTPTPVPVPGTETGTVSGSRSGAGSASGAGASARSPVRVPGPVSGGSSPGADAPPPRARIVASGGRPLPEALPETSSYESGPGTDGATTVYAVEAAHSDALLRALLDASWHIHELTTEGART